LTADGYYRLNTSTSEELGPFFWHHISTLFSQSLAYPENSQQLFDVAQVVFRSLDHLNRESFEMQTNVEEWSHILLSHRSIEVRTWNCKSYWRY